MLNYEKIIKAVQQAIFIGGIIECPVQTVKIANQINAKVIDNSVAKKLSPTEYGKVYLIKGKYYIIYDDTLAKELCRFTIAHELGHIFLKHLEEDNYSWDIELEAEVFAALLLCYPFYVNSGVRV